jgi:hypothetical protein
MDQWIEEVLFRGRPPSGPDSEKSPKLHVVFGMQTEDPFSPGEKIRRTVGPMDMETAKKHGYTPALLVEQINLSAFDRIQELEAQVAEQDEQIALLTAEKSSDS